MAFQPVPDTAQLRFTFDGVAAGPLDGLRWFTSMYVRDDTLTGPWATAKLEQLADYGRDWWDTGKGTFGAARALASNQQSLTEVRAIDVSTEFGAQAFFAPATPLGARAGDPAPPSVPAIVRFAGGAGGAPKRGRVFWSCLSETDLVGDEWLSATATSLEQIFTGFRNGLDDPADGGDINWDQVIVSRNSGTEDDPTPRKIAVRRVTAVTNEIPNPITVRLVVGAQRNRRKGE